MRAANHGIAVRLFITEIGWPSAPGQNTVNEAMQAAYAARLYLLAQSMDFIGGLWWYDLRDDGREAKFGLMHPDFAAKPAFQALTEWQSRLKDAKYLGSLDLPANLAGLSFRARDGNLFQAIWSTDDQVHRVRIGNKNIVASEMPVFIAGDRE